MYIVTVNIDIKPGNEVILCCSCGYPNIIKNTPYKRRKTKNRHIPLDDVDWMFLGKLKEIYGTYSNTMSVLIANANNLLPIFFKSSSDINISVNNSDKK